MSYELEEKAVAKSELASKPSDAPATDPNKMCLYDSDTGKSIAVEAYHKVDTFWGEVVLQCGRAVRGRIVQVVISNSRTHYFYDEESGQNMIKEDAERNGVDLETILKLAEKKNG